MVKGWDMKRCIDMIVLCWMPGVFGRMLRVGGGCTSKKKLMSVTMWEKNVAVCISPHFVLWMKYFFHFHFVCDYRLGREKRNGGGGGGGGGGGLLCDYRFRKEKKRIILWGWRVGSNMRHRWGLQAPGHIFLWKSVPKETLSFHTFPTEYDFFPVLLFPSRSNCLPWLHMLFHIVFVCLQMCICSTAISFFY